jgi:hypothetical protein
MTEAQVEDSKKEFINSSVILKVELIKKIYVRQVRRILVKTDLAFNDYLLKSYIILEFIIKMNLNLLYFL